MVLLSTMEKLSDDSVLLTDAEQILAIKVLFNSYMAYENQEAFDLLLADDTPFKRPSEIEPGETVKLSGLQMQTLERALGEFLEKPKGYKDYKVRGAEGIISAEVNARAQQIDAQDIDIEGPIDQEKRYAQALDSANDFLADVVALRDSIVETNI